MKNNLLKSVILSVILLMGVSNAWGANINGGTTLYLQPNANWNTKDDGKTTPRFAAYFCNGISSAKWYSMSDCNGDGVYEVTVDEGESHKNVIFCRMTPHNSTNDWAQKWNQSSDLTWDGSKDLYTVTDGTWDNGSGTWSLKSVTWDLAGGMNDWSNTTNKFSGSPLSVSVTLKANTTYEFKLHNTEGCWWGNTGTMDRNNCSGWTMTHGSDNCKIKTDFEGTYKFSFDASTKKLTVTYPAAYTVTYDVGTTKGTTSVTTNPSITSGSLVLASTSITFSKGETKAGYQWKNWNSNANGTGTNLGTNATYTSSNRNANTTVYACYDLITYKITYDLNGGSGASNTTYNVESSITLPTPTKTGYTFAGWYDNANLTGNKVTQVAKGSTGDKTFYAKWTANQYTITLDQQGGTGGSESIEVTYDAKLPAITVPTREGYTFGGYFIEDTQYYNQSGTAYYNKTWKIASATTLYAKWTAHTYTVYFNANGGSGDMEDQPFTYDIEQALRANQFTRDGYSFAGWKDWDGKSYVDQQKVKNLTPTDEGQKTLYAQWRPNVSINGTYHFFPGETITLNITTPDDVTFTYQWQKLVGSVWTDIPGATATYIKAEATIADAGHYRCVVSASGYTNAIAYYNVKCLQLNVYYNDHKLAFTTPLDKVDATTAAKSVNLENRNYQYYFEITDGCENFYGFNGDIHSDWYENVPLNAMNSATHCGLQTTKYGTYIFTIDHSYLTDDTKSYPVVSVTYPPALQEAGKVIYWDNSVLEWTHSNNDDGTNKIYYRIGHDRVVSEKQGHNDKMLMTLVPGTANLYKVTTHNYDNFEVWHIANNGGWSGEGNSIYKTKTEDKWAITQAMAFETLPITSPVATVTPTTSIGNGGEDRNNNCKFFNYDITEGMKTHNAIVKPTSNGTITVLYTDHDGTTKSDFTSGIRSLAHTCLLTITAIPDAGYSLASLTVNDVPFISGNVHTLTADATIEATFTINTYIITLDQQGGTGGSESIEVTYDAELPAITIPTREGYTFGGYFTSENGEGTQYYNQEGTAYYKKKWDIASTATLYAKWTPHKFTVKFNANGGDGSMEEQRFTYDIERALSANQFTRVGYSFAGWNDKANGSGTSYADQQVVKNLTATENGEKTLYAQWDAIHTVTWMVNGNQAEGDPTTSVVNGKTITTLPTTPDVDCNGKVFVGWTTAPIHGETPDKPSLLYKELSDFPAVTSNMTFYAVFAKGEGYNKWIETSIDKIGDTDEVVVTMTNGVTTWALNKTLSGQNYPLALVVEGIDGVELPSTEVATEIIWNIGGNSTDGYVFYPKGQTAEWLYCTKSGIVKVGKTTTNRFTIVNGFLKHTNLEALWEGYLAVSSANISDWRMYQSSQSVVASKAQTLKFYKKTTVYTEYTNYSTSCMAGVCDITNANPIYVTSAVGQKIKATEKLVLTTTDMVVGTEISLSAPNITFYKEGVEITQLTTSAASETFELEIGYQPTIANTTEQPTITLEILGYQFAFDNKITGRCLPENFVIAAKWGENWYVLPADMSSETTAEGLLIEVDNPADPTKAIAAPNTTKYSLKSVHTSNQSADRFADYGERLVFVENVEEATPVAYKTLYNGGGNSGSNKTNIQVYAQYSGYQTTNPDRYEWVPTTTDLKDYTLTSAHVFTDEAARTISLDKHGVFGTLLQDKSYNGMVRLLPVDEFYTPVELQVVEWKANSVSIMYTGAGTKATTKVGNNSESEVQLLSDDKIKIDHAVYTLATSDLTAATNQVLTISIKDDAENTIGTLKLTIPWIVSGPELSTSRVASEVTQATDIVVLDGATLTADATKYTYNDVVVYPGGKLVIGESGKLGMYSLTLRLGSSWGAAKYEHKYPEFVLNTTTSQAYSNTSGKINLDYVTTKSQYYTFVAPFEVKTKDIKYPVDIYGSNVEAANRGSFEFQYYDGEARARGEKGWKVVEEDPTNGATLNAHQGYTFLGMPKKVNGTRQKFGIHRIPMSIGATKVMEHENSEQSITVTPHPSEKNNNSGWNLIGNPYMTTITGLTNNDIQVGKLVHINDAQGNWTGKWQWDEETVKNNQRFLVIPSNDGQSYEAVQASNATLPAFKNFFVQIGNENANALGIPRTTPAGQLLAPARHTEEIVQDIELAIVLEQDTAHADQMDFLITDIYTADFDYNADFTKMMNATDLNLYGVHPYDNLSFVAMDNNTARGSVAIGYQVPQAGEYILRMSDKPYVMFDKIEALYVTDHEMSPEVTTDIMSEPYRFTVANAETNHTRFTVSVILKTEEDDGGGDVGTGVDNTTNSNTPCKFIYQDKMYILLNGVIYDAMGKQVQTINK